MAADRLKALLEDLAASRVSVQQAAAQVRGMSLSRMPALTVAQQMAADNDVPPLLPDGGAAELAQAFFERRITAREYEILAGAAAQAYKQGEGQPAPG